jgi:hypothetical protein
MITPEDIRERARKLWRTGRPMVSLLPGAEPLFPYLVPFRKPTAREWLNEFAKLRSAVETLERESKNVRGIGYSIEFREVAHQKLSVPRWDDFERSPRWSSRMSRDCSPGYARVRSPPSTATRTSRRCWP